MTQIHLLVSYMCTFGLALALIPDILLPAFDGLFLPIWCVWQNSAPRENLWIHGHVVLHDQALSVYQGQEHS